MFLESHVMKMRAIIEKYDANGNLVEIRYPKTYTNEEKQQDAFIEAEIYSEKNELIEKQTYPVRSPVNNLLNYFSASFMNHNAAYQNQAGSTSAANIQQAHRFAVSLADGEQYAGIGVGKNIGGIAAILSHSVQWTDYNLKNKIVQGTVSGTLWHGASFFTPEHFSGSYHIIKYERVFSNATSESINIGEIGLFSPRDDTTSGYLVTEPLLIYRDVTDYTGNLININLLPYQSLHVKYNLLTNTSSLLPNVNWMKTLNIDSTGIIGRNTVYATYMNPIGLTNFISYRNTGRTTGSSTPINTHINANYTAQALASLFQSEWVNHPANGDSKVTCSLEVLNNEKWLYVMNRASTEWNKIVRGTPYCRDLQLTYLVNTNVTASYTTGVIIRCQVDTATGLADINNGLSIFFNSSSLRLSTNTGRTGTEVLIATSSGHTFNKDTNYYIKTYASHSVIKVRTWESGTVEPGTWSIDLTNVTASTNYTNYGQIGVITYKNAPTNTTYFNDFAIDYLDFNFTPNNYMIRYDCGYSNFGFARYYAKSPAGWNTCGIVVGSNNSTTDVFISTSSATFFDFKLNNVIEHGTSPGTLYYGTSNILPTTSTTASGKAFEFNRQFVNQSTENVSVGEFALYTLKANLISWGATTYPTIPNTFETCMGRVLTGSPLILSSSEAVLIRIIAEL